MKLLLMVDGYLKTERKDKTTALRGFNFYIMKCIYNFYTCSNLKKEFHCKELCETCEEGQNYQHIDNFLTVESKGKKKKK